MGQLDHRAEPQPRHSRCVQTFVVRKMYAIAALFSAANRTTRSCNVAAHKAVMSRRRRVNLAAVGGRDSRDEMGEKATHFQALGHVMLLKPCEPSVSLAAHR